MKNVGYHILLYYKYVPLADPQVVRDEQFALCRYLNLKGRIIIAQEGINGTLEGLTADTEKYIAAMEKTSYFAGIHYKKSSGTGSAFPKLSIRVRKEIVTAGISNLDPNKVTGKYITSERLHQWFIYKKEFYIVDMRNDFEYSSGYFTNFIPSGMKHFSDLPTVLPKLQHLKDKTLITVCTGGIRCEKASGFLVMHGFKDVYQLQDGIVTYMEQYPNEHFKGKLYVFDNRLTMGFNTDDPQHEIVGKCMHCGKPCDSYVNCEYDVCHYHYIACSDCKDAGTNLYFCKEECKELYLQESISLSL